MNNQKYLCCLQRKITSKLILCLFKLKLLLVRWNIHVLIEPFSGVFLYLIYLSKFSKWRRSHPPIAFNDFYNSQYDHNRRFEMYEFLIKKENLDSKIIYLEFGVARGDSFKWWVTRNEHPDSRFFGFDTFEGLPENWRILKKGFFSTRGEMPDTKDPRCQFIKGLFQDTLQGFLDKTALEGKLVVHLDADLYSSTSYVLNKMSSYFRKDDIIVFDEFNVPPDEFRAFLDFFNSHKMKYELLAACNNYQQAAIKFL